MVARRHGLEWRMTLLALALLLQAPAAAPVPAAPPPSIDQLVSLNVRNLGVGWSQRGCISAFLAAVRAVGGRAPLDFP